jgi:hypothetical protein
VDAKPLAKLLLFPLGERKMTAMLRCSGAHHGILKSQPGVERERVN